MVNEEGQLRCLRSLGPNLRDNIGLLPPSPRRTRRPVLTLANSPSAGPRAPRPTLAAVDTAKILYIEFPTRCKWLIPRLLPIGHTRTVRSFGLVLCLESSHLSMNIGTRLVLAVLTRSFPQPLPERWTRSRYAHTTRTPAGSLPGE